MSEAEKRKGKGAAEEGGTEKTVRRIYVGPGFRGVAKGSIFEGEFPEHLKEEIRKLPAIGELMVEIEKLVEANKELSDKNSRLSALYSYVEKKKKGV